MFHPLQNMFIMLCQKVVSLDVILISNMLNYFNVSTHLDVFFRAFHFFSAQGRAVLQNLLFLVFWGIRNSSILIFHATNIEFWEWNSTCELLSVLFKIKKMLCNGLQMNATKCKFYFSDFMDKWSKCHQQWNVNRHKEHT